MDGHTDPPSIADHRPGRGDRERAPTELHPVGTHDECHVDPVVDEEPRARLRRRLHQRRRQPVEFAGAQPVAAHVQRDRRAVRLDDRPRARREIGRAKDRIVGDQVQAREHQAKWSPVLGPLPRTHSADNIRRFPAGLTSRT